jgi:Lar family restriction alleviation protein
MGVMQVKPKPCPNCGSKYVEMWTKFFGSNGFEVRCLDCGYIGELGKTRASAVRAWNNDERRKKNAGL